MSKIDKILGVTLAAALLAPGVGFAQDASAANAAPAAQPAKATAASPPATPAAAPAAPAASPATPPEAASAAPATPPSPVAAAPVAPAVTAPPRISVALVITPELKKVVWSHTPEILRPMYEVGDVNDLGLATEDALEDLLKTMALDVHVVASADEAQKVSGASYFLAPTIQRYEEHNQGLTTFSPFIETIVVQWKVTDAKGNTVLLDTVLASASGKLGNNFIAGERAQNIEIKMLADLKTKSTALLQPVLVSP